jgi:hypothetical protein
MRSFPAQKPRRALDQSYRRIDISAGRFVLVALRESHEKSPNRGAALPPALALATRIKHRIESNEPMVPMREASSMLREARRQRRTDRRARG